MTLFLSKLGTAFSAIRDPAVFSALPGRFPSLACQQCRISRIYPNSYRKLTSTNNLMVFKRSISSTKPFQAEEQKPSSPGSAIELFDQTFEQLQQASTKLKKKRGVPLGRERAPDEAHAVVHRLKVSVQKLNLVAKLIRGLNYYEAVAQLKLCEKRCAVNVLRLLQSCRYNAENNFKLDVDRLVVAFCFVGKGKFVKKIRHHSKGRMGRVLSERSRISIVLKQIPAVEGEKRLGRDGKTHVAIAREKERRQNAQTT